MMRSILIAAVVGVLSAVLASYFLTAPARQGQTAISASPDTAAFSIANRPEAWPICSTMAAMVETPDWAALDPDFAAGGTGQGQFGSIQAVQHVGPQCPLGLRGESRAELADQLDQGVRAAQLGRG